MMCDYDCEGCNCDPTPRVKPWKRWLDSHDYIVLPIIAAAGLFAMFWVAEHV